MIFRARQHRPLIAQPPEVANKHQHEQNSTAGGNPDLCPGEGHFIEFRQVARAREDYRRDMYDCGKITRKQVLLDVAARPNRSAPKHALSPRTRYKEKGAAIGRAL
jgi:hypothetical protein